MDLARPGSRASESESRRTRYRSRLRQTAAVRAGCCPRNVAGKWSEPDGILPAEAQSQAVRIGRPEPPWPTQPDDEGESPPPIVYLSFRRLLAARCRKVAL